jgi:hypothetical protein
MSLARQWAEAKEVETRAIRLRRDIEDEMIAFYKISNQMEGTQNEDEGIYKIKIVNRITRKVDSEKVQELAAEFGLTDHLSQLFRWTPEINATAWKSAHESITRPLMDAITATPGRPSFSITIKE